MLNLQRKEIPSLYGLRGIAAIVVVVFHTLEYMQLNALDMWLPGDSAVALFFELSGLLITWLLLKEKSETGSIHLKKFYERRALRLFPAFYMLWLLCLPIPHVHARWLSFVYMRDIASMLPNLAPGIGVLGMAWSLGVEEKFYLIWPGILRRLHSKQLAAILVCIGILDQLYRIEIGRLGQQNWAAYGFETHLDAILFGTALAVAAKDGWRPPRWMLNPLVLIASLTAVEGMPFVIRWPMSLTVGTAVTAYPLLLVLIYVISKPPKVLNNPVAKFFGNISYSLYLYHLLVIYLLSKVHFPHWREQITVTVAGSTLAAAASYYFVERPFLLLKDRLHPKHRRTQA